MTVTSADVASAAGVSRATVSYVLNDKPGKTISPATRDLVQRVARELGYRPSAAARSLRSGKGVSVLLPLPGLGRHFVLSQLVDACSEALGAVGLGLVPDHTVHAGPEEQLDAWLRLAPAAVIDLALRHDDPVREGLARYGVPVLSTAASPSVGDAATWGSTSDVFAAVVRDTQVLHLLDGGGRDLVVVRPRAPRGAGRSAQRITRQMQRLAAARGARLREVQLPLEAGALRELVAGWCEGGLPDAVAAYNDDYGLALVTALVHAGVRVPQDVRVMGVDDIPLARLTTPSLTTIAADFTGYAEAVARAVLAAVEGDGTTALLPLPDHRVRVRETA